MREVVTGEKPFLCLYDIEKAFDSVEFPILLRHLFSIGINGKSWRLIKAWYQSPTSRVNHDNKLSESFPVSRGVKQGSVLSPSLFLVIMNSLLQKMRHLNCGGSLVSRARPFTDSCPPGRKGLITRAHTFGDFPHDSWGTILLRVLLIGSCVFFTVP